MKANPVIATVKRAFAAPPERVFDAWLDPATAAHWMFATPNGRMRHVDIEAHVGGRFYIAEQRGDALAEHFGEYLEIDRPWRLVFTFAVEKNATAPDRVTIDIVATAAGCELTLTHEMAPEYAEYAKRTHDGWSGMLNGLDRSLAST